MAAASNYLEDKLLNHVLTGTAYTQPVGRYVALFNDVSAQTETRLEQGILTDEVNTGGYQRVAVTFNAAANGNSTNNAMVTFPIATANWGTITHVAVMDAQTGGNVLFWAPVVIPKTINTGDTFLIFVNNLSISLN